MDLASPELVALLATCRARPADDLPRLVLADWLDENGDPDRAEFVRVQVELSHPTADAKRTAELRGIEQGLLTANHGEWTGGVHELLHPESQYQPGFPWYDWAFRRGLLSVTQHLSKRWLLSDPAFLNWLRAPAEMWLDQVKLPFTWPETFVKADLPDRLSGRVSLTLDLTGREDDPALVEQFRVLAVSGNFAFVHSLRVVGVPGLRVLEPLCRTDVSRLVRLSMPGSGDQIRAVNLVASAPFASLSSLDIGRLDEPALRALIRSPYLGNLTELNLIGSPIGDAGMAALCGSKLADTLRAVEFPNTGLGDAGAVALARSPLFAHLHGPRLNLMMNRIGDVGLKAIAESEHLLRFSELVLRANFDPEVKGSGIGDEGVIALAESPYSANLRFLDFWRNRITDRGAFALARSPHLNSVVDLSVKENAVTAAGAAALHERFGEAAKT